MGGSRSTAGEEVLRRGLDLALAQGGVVRREQLHDFGISPARIRAWIRAGVWVPHASSVLTLPGVGDGLKVRSLIVAHRLYSVGVLTGPSALAVRDSLATEPWDALPRCDEPWVIHPHRVSVPARVLRRQPDRWRVVLGVRVAPPQVVMVDLLRFLPEPDARNLAYRAGGTSEWAAFMQGLAERGEEHRHEPGVVQLRGVARRVGTGARSEAEHLLHTILRTAELTGWQANFPVTVGGRRYRIDVAFSRARIAVEIDGRAFHGHDRFQSDRTRQNALVGAGWLLLRYTWEDLTQRPDQVVREIRAALAERG